jgi:poly(3-hydroxybutyrate) depolymerase
MNQAVAKLMPPPDGNKSMRFRSAFYATMVAMVLAGVQTKSFCQSKAAPTGDQHRQYDFAAAGCSMPYRLYVPSQYDGARLYPLIVWLHGSGDDENDDFDTTDLRKLAEARGVILVSPLGYNRYGGYGDIYPVVATHEMAAAAEAIGAASRSGEAPAVAIKGTGGDQSHFDPAITADYVEIPAGFLVDPHVGLLSEQDVMNVVGLVRKEYHIDPARVYLMGNSMGGVGTLFLAARYPEVWAAVAPAGGPIAVWSYPFERLRDFHVPVLFVHGGLDEHANAHWSQVLFERAREVGVEADLSVPPKGDHNYGWATVLPQTFDWLLRHQKPSMNGMKTQGNR